MADIYIFKYNNYYNREAKPPLSLDDMFSRFDVMHKQYNVNFNPNDGVNTMLTVGKAGNWYNGKGDYLVVDNNDIDGSISRWFILDHTRRCRGQWALKLRRDVIADNYNAVLSSTCFVERGTVDEFSPFIFNQEPIPVNQIKTKETLLKDSTGCAWICGYLNRSYAGGELTDLRISDFIPDITVSSIESWEWFGYLTSYYIQFRRPVFKWRERPNTPYYNGKTNPNAGWETINFASLNQVSSASFCPGYAAMTKLRGIVFEAEASNALGKMAETDWARAYTEAIYDSASNAYFDSDAVMGPNRFNAATQLEGKIVYDQQANTYYKIGVNINPFKTRSNITYDKSSYPLYTKLYNIVESVVGSSEMSGFTNAAAIEFEGSAIQITLTAVSAQNLTATMPNADERLHLKDAPYDMFCIPYGEVLITNSESSMDKIEIHANESILIAQELARNIGSANIYDLQLLPYCPMTGFFIDGNTIDISTTDKKRYTTIENGTGSPISILLWSTASQGTLDIALDEWEILDESKIANQCDIYRLVSPNYNGQFEYSAAKTRRPVSTFNVDYTYLPYKSYIHINPTFGGLYGKDFNDVRGLVCQGDFSIAYLSDAWVNYQVSNKNYANIFARQIENMEVNHKYDRIENITNAAGNALAAGVAAGAMSGNAIVGVAAGVASAAAGAADVAIAESRFAEQLSYQEDIFNMQLENIRAMPYSIASQTAYSANNKIFPILEYYTCTIEERRQVATYIANKGMTLGVIGTLSEYTIPWGYSDDQFKVVGRGYIKAQLIYIDIGDDSHLTQAIADELRKGVYFNS